MGCLLISFYFLDSLKGILYSIERFLFLLEHSLQKPFNVYLHLYVYRFLAEIFVLLNLYFLRRS